MMTQLCEGLQRRDEVEAIYWAHIQPMRDGVQLALRITRQIRALGQILAPQAIGVLGGRRITKNKQKKKKQKKREPMKQKLE